MSPNDSTDAPIPYAVSQPYAAPQPSALDTLCELAGKRGVVVVTRNEAGADVLTAYRKRGRLLATWARRRLDA